MGELDRLWAPWRARFLSSRPGRGCIFCRAKRSREDHRHQVVSRGGRVFALLNRYPYNNGHVMVAPYRHVGTFEALRSEEWQEMFSMSRRVMSRLAGAIHPHGFNVGFNLGRVAGAGIPGHLHLHIVPRWQGDTNFMPIFGQTKVISQSLEEIYRLLAEPRG